MKPKLKIPFQILTIGHALYLRFQQQLPLKLKLSSQVNAQTVIRFQQQIFV